MNRISVIINLVISIVQNHLFNTIFCFYTAEKEINFFYKHSTPEEGCRMNLSKHCVDNVRHEEDIQLFEEKSIFMSFLEDIDNT